MTTSSTSPATAPGVCDRCGKDYDRPIEPLVHARPRGESVSLCDDCTASPPPATTAPALKEYDVWADRRFFLVVEATSPEEAYRIAQEHPSDFEPCSDGIENFEFYPFVADLETDEEFRVGEEPDPVKAELLAALKLAMVAMAENDLGHTPEAKEIFEQCKAAIARAEGS